MVVPALVALLYDAWDDFDRASDGLAAEEAVRRVDGGSSFAWTAAHLANQVDAWVNVRIHGSRAHPLISEPRFRFGGTGAAEDRDAIRAGVREVRETARSHLGRATEATLDARLPYDGSLAHVRPVGLTLRYALYRAITHHYFHLGEIASKRRAMGHDVGDYPGELSQSLMA